MPMTVSREVGFGATSKPILTRRSRLELLGRPVVSVAIVAFVSTIEESCNSSQSIKYQKLPSNPTLSTDRKVSTNGSQVFPFAGAVCVI